MDPGTLHAFRRRDAHAVRAMYDTYGRLVYSVAHHVLGRHDLAEEATQHAFVNAWRAADRLDVERDPAPWLATIARRAAIDIHRREARRPTSALSEMGTREHVATATLPVEPSESVWQVRAAIDALPRDEATVVRLQHLDGLTHREISDKLGIALGTVKSRSHRAHRSLARLLGHLREAPRD